jgi:hypothetical protein
LTHSLQDNGKGRIKFVNIAADDYNPSKNMGIEYEEAMETIHAILPDGSVSGTCSKIWTVASALWVTSAEVMTGLLFAGHHSCSPSHPGGHLSNQSSVPLTESWVVTQTLEPKCPVDAPCAMPLMGAGAVRH